MNNYWNINKYNGRLRCMVRLQDVRKYIYNWITLALREGPFNFKERKLWGVFLGFFLVLNIVEILLKLEEITNVFSENNDNLIFVRCKKYVLLLAPNVKWSVSNLMVKTHFCFECIFSLSMHMFRFSLYLGLNVPNGYSITKLTSLSV